MSLLRKKSAARLASATKSKPVNGPALQDSQSEVLLRRFTTWKRVVKALIAFLEGVAKQQASGAKEIDSLAAAFAKVVPFEDSNQFLPQSNPSGFTSLINQIRTKAHDVAEHNANAAGMILNQSIEPLKKLREDIRSFLKSIETDLTHREKEVKEQRDLSATALTALRSALAQARANVAVEAQTDPYVVDRAARRALEMQIDGENALHQATASWQKQAASFEKDIVHRIKGAWSAFVDWQERTAPLIGKEWANISNAIGAAPEDAEWSRYLELHQMLDASAPLRLRDSITYPGQNDELSQPTMEGRMQRKKRFTKMRSTGHLILTPTGHLHWLAKDEEDISLSLALANCMLGPAPETDAKTQAFWVGGAKSATGSVSDKMRGTFKIKPSETEHVFIAKTHAEIMAWWDACSKFAKASYSTLHQAPSGSMASSDAVTNVGLNDGIESDSVSDEEEEEANDIISSYGDVEKEESPADQEKVAIPNGHFAPSETIEKRIPSAEKAKEADDPAPAPVYSSNAPSFQPVMPVSPVAAFPGGAIGYSAGLTTSSAAAIPGVEATTLPADDAKKSRLAFLGRRPSAQRASPPKIREKA